MLRENISSIANRTQRGAPECDSSYELAIITLTLPIWTFVTFYFLIFLIYYLRRIQYFKLFDKCLPRNAHFRYDFQMVIGKHSINYNKLESMIILDLLDSQLVSNMTIQIPGSTIYNEDQVFTYKHHKPNLRSVLFSIHRRLPIKDVKCIRLAHNCSQIDSRIYIYAVDFYDATNSERKFFPVTSVIKYRGTQWALQTTFEPRNDVNFRKLGISCSSDLFSYSYWPSALEVLIIIFYMWGSMFCFGNLIGVKELLDSTSLHATTISFLTASSVAVICFVYLYFIKSHLVDNHYDSLCFEVSQWIVLTTIVVVSTGFWILAFSQKDKCLKDTKEWVLSSVVSGVLLTIILLIIHLVFKSRRNTKEIHLFQETDATLSRTNSKTSLEFIDEPTTSWTSCCRSSEVDTNQLRAIKLDHGTKMLKNTTASTTQSIKAPTQSAKTTQGTSLKNGLKEVTGAKTIDSSGRREEETLDNAYGKYIKTKNRNSISQYV